MMGLLVSTLVGLGIARAAAVGAAILVLQDSNTKTLSAVINADLAKLEKICVPP